MSADDARFAEAGWASMTCRMALRLAGDLLVGVHSGGVQSERTMFIRVRSLRRVDAGLLKAGPASGSAIYERGPISTKANDVVALTAADVSRRTKVDGGYCTVPQPPPLTPSSAPLGYGSAYHGPDGHPVGAG